MRFSLNYLVLFALIFSVSGAENEEVTIEVVEKPTDCERKSKDGDLLAMHYTGRLEKDGSIFDSSHNRGQTFDFTLGRGQVIQGWEQGLKDMCVGEKRKLRVPAHLGKLVVDFVRTIDRNATRVKECDVQKARMFRLWYAHFICLYDQLTIERNSKAKLFL